MVIDPVLSFNAALEQARYCGNKLIFWEKKSDTQIPAPARPHSPAKVFVMVGPEGGFGASDLERLVAADFRRIGLGPRVLRTETAAIAVCALAQACWGDF